MYRSGDWVVYSVCKQSAHPGRRAREVSPAPQGEFYSYVVDKYWTVQSIAPGGQLLLATRRGKQRTVPADDPNLRAARWWERLFLRHRFPQLHDSDPAVRKHAGSMDAHASAS